jgi:phosphatidylglycerol:prolipoprotein diacylglycerol transferase
MDALPFPAIHPEIFPPCCKFDIGGWQFGPFALRWYALAYIVGLVLGWRYCLAVAKKPPLVARPVDIDDFLVWATLGVVVGGRLGYVLFYNREDYLAHPLEVLYLWRGGMSFHGGAAGVVLAIFLFCRLRNISFFAFGDIICCAVPIGLLFGRIANFINGELWGRAAAAGLPWAMKFPSELLTNGKAPEVVSLATKIDPRYGVNLRLNDNIAAIIAAYPDDPRIHDLLLSNSFLTPRHPSQIYEALLEGVVLFLVLWVLQRSGARQRLGLIAGVFLLGYGLARFVVEFVREPDFQLEEFTRSVGLSVGQLLSLPLVVAGLWLMWRAWRRAARA